MLIEHTDMKYDIVIDNFKKSNILQYVRLTEYAQASIETQHLIPSTEHREGYIVFYVNEGQGTIYSNQELIGLKENDLAIIDVSQNFYITSHSWKFTYFHINGKMISKILEKRNYTFSISSPDSFNHMLRGLVEEIHASKGLLITSRILMILGELLENKTNEYNIVSHHSPIREALEYIKRNFTSTITVEHIAEHINYSKYYFIRFFKKEVGTTPYRYIINTRLNHAKYLLSRSSLHVKEIANESGFNSEENFYYTFRKEVGTTPLKFRRKEENYE